MKFPWKNKPSVLDEPITEVLNEMNRVGPTHDGYPDLVAHLDRLTEMKAQERKNKVSQDTMWLVGGGILQVLVIVVYEQKHVWVSKALGFVQKVK